LVLEISLKFQRAKGKEGWRMRRKKQTYIQPILPCAAILFFISCYATAGTWTTLDYPGATQTYVSGISGNNIVGYYGSSRGFLYDGTNWTTIDMPTAKATVIRGISGNKIVGEYLPSDSPLPFGPWKSFLYDGTNWITIPLPTGGGFVDISYGIDGDIIASRNQIYNTATQSLTTLNYPGAARTMICGIDGSNLVGSYDNHGFVYNMDTQNWTTIDYPGATYTRIYGIDGSNLIGSSTLNGNKLTDFIYDGSNLHALDVPGSPSGIYGNIIVGSYTTTIHSDNGAIGVFSNGYVYTIPEPATLVILALGAVILKKPSL
jgi:hypothetical protein